MNGSGGAGGLPSIEECLFGVTGNCPKMTTTTTSTGDDDDDSSTAASAAAAAALAAALDSSTQSGEYDNLSAGHWGDAAAQHDIDLVQLRRLCSQGIADEGSYRGVAWRVLLGYLPTQDIAKTWPATIPPQRDLYDSLVRQYMEGPPDPGVELKGRLSKTLSNRSRLRTNYNRLQRLDETDSNEDDGSMNSSNEDDDDDDSDSNNSRKEKEEEASQQAKAEPEAAPLIIATILDRLPVQFREQWKRSGISLDNKSMRNVNDATALGINLLTTPEITSNAEFQVFLEDAKLLEEIRKDVVRTHPDLGFFLEPQGNLGLRRYAALERILFVWSKLNKGVRYVQGMNEIVGTLYYVLANDHNSDWANNAEADTYFLFHTILMGDMRDVFCPDMDTSRTGIQGRIDQLGSLLKTHDPEVQEHLEGDCAIDASFYAIRWLTTLLSREFLLPDTIRLWDSMFASSHKENFLRYVCGTMVMMIRQDLLKGDFSTCLRLLQSYPNANMDVLLESSRSLWIYESQITLACHKGGISLHHALQTVSPPPAIIMAFGLRGGVAPKVSVTEQVQHELAHAKEGLMGKAKRFWNGWGEGRTSTATAPAVVPPPPRSRVWNRGRSEDSATTSTSTTEREGATTTEGSTNDTGEGVNISLGLASLREEVAVPTIVTPTRRPIWNRGGGANEPLQFEEELSSRELMTAAAAAPRRAIWKKSSTPSRNASTTNVHQNLIS